MMPDTRYEEYETMLAPGVSLLFYSDGLVEAHNPQHEMYGFPRLMISIEEYLGGPGAPQFLAQYARHFTGNTWEQEDDVTMVVLQRGGVEEGTTGKDETRT